MFNRIALAGDYRVGKDYLGNKFVTELGYTRVAFADILKEIACTKYPDKAELVMAPTKTPEARQLLCQLGLELNTNQKRTTTFIASQLVAKADKVIITDLRFEEELEYCKLNGFTIIYIGPKVDNYALSLIHDKANLHLPSRPKVSAKVLLSLLNLKLK